MSTATTKQPSSITKRDKSTVPFDADKIRNAIYQCLNTGLGEPEETCRSIGDSITQCALNILVAREENPTVEQVQDIVEQQLLAAGLLDGARAYIRYRDQRAQVRKARPTVSSEDAAIIEAGLEHLPSPLQQYQFLSKYARWLDDKGRRETWEEAITRVITFFRKKVGSALREDEWKELEQAMLRMEAMPAMRILQMAGPAAEREHLCAYNCAAVAIDDLAAFSEILYILMQGTGCGFSVETEFVDKLPRVRKQKAGLEPETFIIPDTTEGWCDALKFGLECWFGGKDVRFDYSQIRPQGARLKVKGGRASGSAPIKQLLDFARERVLAHQGSRLSPLDCHDIICQEGSIVHLGGVRRAAELSHSDLDDEEMRAAKHGQFWNQNPQRMMANNSVAYNEKPTAVEFMEEWLALAKSGSGERGIFNREGVIKHIPKRRKRSRFLVNPCAEIILRETGGLCNLSLVVARPDDTLESLKRKVRVAAIFGTIQSTLTDFNYVRPQWKKNADEERLLGVDINGQMDCPLLRPGAEGRTEFLEHLLQVVLQVNQEYAARLGINPSVATTCVKPAGNSSVLFNCSPGIHPRFSDYYIRRVRAGAFDPLTRMLQDVGVPWHPEVGQAKDQCSVVVFEFPVASPEGAITKDDMTAIEQLENWLIWRKHYAEHTVSITVYVDDHEWLEVGNWVYQNWDWVSGISFLPRVKHIYQLAPYQAISKEEFEMRTREFPVLDWSALALYELEDQTTSSGEFACTSGGCNL